jgi:hypothetical protein
MRLLAFIVCLAASLAAQKAEPLAIHFPDGKSSTAVEGELTGRQEAEYSLRARKNQALVLQLTAPAAGLEIKLHDPDGGEATLRQSGHRWTAVTRKAGDYVLSVTRTTDQPGTSTYKLTVSIR